MYKFTNRSKSKYFKFKKNYKNIKFILSKILEKKNIIIFKNDAVGDLSQSLDAINNIINYNKNNKITIYLSERSANFNFLLNYENIKIKKVNYDLSLIDKIEIIKFILKHQFLSIYILTPKKFYFYLPVIFRKIKFYALCLNGNNNYRRPSEFLRKYLHKYVVNDRSSIKKRQSTMKSQVNLTAYSPYKLCGHSFRPRPGLGAGADWSRRAPAGQ